MKKRAGFKCLAWAMFASPQFGQSRLKDIIFCPSLQVNNSSRLFSLTDWNRNTLPREKLLETFRIISYHISSVTNCQAKKFHCHTPKTDASIQQI